MLFRKSYISGHRILLFSMIIFLINAFLRLWFLDKNPVAHDEPFSIFHAQLTPGQIVEELGKGNNPPLYELLLHYWTGWFGISAFSARFLSAVFTSFSAVVIFKLGIRWAGVFTGLLAAALFTISTYHMQFSHEARSYALLCLLSLLSFSCFMRLLVSDGRWTTVLWWSIINIILAYTHYFGVAVMFLQLVIGLLFYRKKRPLVAQTGAMVLSFIIAFWPWAATLWNRFLEAGSQGTWLRTSTWEDLYNAWWSFSNSPVCAVFFALLLLAFLISLMRTPTAAPRGTAVIICWFFIPFLGMFFISWEHSPIRVPVFLDRYMIFFSPALYLLIAHAAQHLVERIKLNKAWILLPLIVFSVSFKINPDNKRDSKSVVEWVRERKTPEATVIIAPADFRLNFCYYYETAYFVAPTAKDIYQRMDSLMANEQIFVATSDYLREEWKNIGPLLIYVDAGTDFTWKGQHLKQALLDHYRLSETQKFKSIFEVSIFKPRE